MTHARSLDIDRNLLTGNPQGLENGPSRSNQRRSLLTSARDLLAKGKKQDARRSIQDALRCDDGDAGLIADAAMIAEELDPDMALDLLRRATEKAPQQTGYWLMLAKIAFKQGDVDLALSAAEKVRAVEPQHEEACLLVANIAINQKNFVAAEEALSFLPSKPKDVDAIESLRSSLAFRRGRIDEGCAHLRRLSKANVPLRLEMARLMRLNYDPELSRMDLAAAHRAFGQRFHDVSPYRDWPGSDPSSERKLKIGYLSADFCAHSVAYFIAPLFKAFDRDAFDVIAYAHLQSSDNITDYLKGLVTGWRDVTKLDAKELAACIRRDGIDILIELGGMTKNSRIDALSYRPAPVQISYIGYPNTTGIPQIDYRITDHLADPEGSDLDYTETLIRVPGCFLSFEKPGHAPDIGPPPSERNGFVTFGSFNNLAKVNQDVVSLWADVLRSVPSSMLLMKAAGIGDISVREDFCGRFSALGVDPTRLRFEAFTETTSEHFDLYNEVDIALDTFPYNGTTTTLEALWMGVPVVTLSGDRHAARVGCSLLTNLKFPAGVAATTEDYVHIARLLAEQSSLRFTLRGNLRSEMAQSSLCDGIAHTRILEQAYQEVWRLSCAQRQG